MIVRFDFVTLRIYFQSYSSAHIHNTEKQFEPSR